MKYVPERVRRNWKDLLCMELNSILPKVVSFPELLNVSLFGNRVKLSVIR